MSYYGEPEDKPGECNARLYIGDDFGARTAAVKFPMAKSSSNGV